MIPINPEAIGDPNQTPVVYLGVEAGKALGIPQRDSSPPSPAQCPDGQTEPPVGSLVHLTRYYGVYERTERGWIDTFSTSGGRAMEWDALLRLNSGDLPVLLVPAADLDAARQERDEARATLSIVEANFRELEAERDELRQELEAVAEALRRVEQERDDARADLAEANEIVNEAYNLHAAAVRDKNTAEAALAEARRGSGYVGPKVKGSLPKVPAGPGPGSVVGTPHESTGQVDLERAIGRANQSVWWLSAEHPDFLPLSVREHFDHDWPALLADLDAAREALRRAEQERDEWRSRIGRMVRAVAERDRMLPVVEAARNWFDDRRYDAHTSVTARHLAAAVDTYETQEGTE